MVNSVLDKVTKRIIERSRGTRDAYEAKLDTMKQTGVQRAHLSCGNLAHAYAAMGADQARLLDERQPNIGIITAYNDMLSAHQPYQFYPERIKAVARKCEATAQVAGGVPAMCDGVTQGQVGMEMSLFSRDVIAMASAVALSHNVFDGVAYLGVCDKIVPGLVMAAASFGHLPAVFMPAGPMPSGIPNEEKAATRKKFAAGEVGRDELMRSELASYHSPGTCTFYGTANTNQMLMEIMGFHLPSSSFVAPYTPLRDALTDEATRVLVDIMPNGKRPTPASDILAAKNFVNGIVGLNATGGSTNLLIHYIAMARAAGLIITWEDFHEISDLTPLLAKVYPNSLADVNQFHAAGGLGYLMRELLANGLLHGDAKTILGTVEDYLVEPQLDGDKIKWVESARESLSDKIIRPVANPFQATGGLKELTGNLGSSVMKVSSIDPDRHVIEAKARVFDNQDDVKAAFQKGEFTEDTIVVVRFQGPRANGMPELHSLTPVLSVLQDRGLRVALLTDGRMSGASGKVPAAIHLSPEAAAGGPIARIRDGDFILIDADKGTVNILDEAALDRPAAQVDLSQYQEGTGRELFARFREHCDLPAMGASPLFSE